MEQLKRLSLCMIVKDEEETLGKCLQSVAQFVDEIIIVDTGSTDDTKTIAQSFGARVVDFQWQEDFGLARNFAFSQATGMYIMWMDADDFVPDAYREALQQTIDQLDGSIDYVSAEHILVRRGDGEPSFVLKRNRIVRREMGFRWIGKVHEYLEVYGKGYMGTFAVEHSKVKEHTDRNLKIYRGMEERGEVLPPRDLYYYGNELREHGFYEEAIEKYKAFIAGKQGWIEDVKAAYYWMIVCCTYSGKQDQVVPIALESFACDVPKAEICYELGEHYHKQGVYKQAIFWYQATYSCKPDAHSLAMDNKSYYTWLPSLQLCVCYDKIGNLQRAYFFNELAASFDPELDQVAYNRRYFSEEAERRGVVLPPINSPIRWGEYELY